MVWEVTQQTFPIAAHWLDVAGPWLVLWVLIVALLLPLAVASRSSRFRAGCGLALSLVMAIGGVQIWQARGLGVELTPDYLVLHGATQTKIASDRIHGQRARVIRLDEQPSFEIAAPLSALREAHYSSGWVVLRNGMVVFALVGEGREWVVVPTSDQFYVALDPVDTQGLRRALGAWSRGHHQDTL